MCTLGEQGRRLSLRRGLMPWLLGLAAAMPACHDARQPPRMSTGLI
jgi:hypothetical protein